MAEPPPTRKLTIIAKDPGLRLGGPGGPMAFTQVSVPAEILAKEAIETVIELEHMGLPFNRTPDGRIDQRRFGGHTRNYGEGPVRRSCFAADRTGHMILQTLYQQAIKHGVTFYDEYHVVDLLTEGGDLGDGGRAAGVVAYRIADGTLHTIPAKAVLLATGGFGRMFRITSNAWSLTGDGVALVRRVLAEATTPPRWPMYPRQFKQFLRTAQPDFDERKYGSIADLMRAGDRLRALAQVEVTTDHHEAKISIGEPYAFDPEVRMRLLLADNVKGRDGQVLAEGTWRCSQTRHHHVLSLDQALAINAAQAAGKHLVAVLDAWHRQAEDGQIVLVGQNEGVSKVINQDMARISAVRYRGAKDDDGQTSASDQARVSELPLSSDRRGVYSLELRNLRQGEQFIVKARLLTSTTRLAHPARVRVLELLAEREHTVGELAEATGLELSHLSQQVSVLRRAGIVDSRRVRSNVICALRDQQTAELLGVARRLLSRNLRDGQALLAALDDADDAVSSAGSGRARA